MIYQVNTFVASRRLKSKVIGLGNTTHLLKVRFALFNRVFAIIICDPNGVIKN